MKNMKNMKNTIIVSVGAAIVVVVIYGLFFAPKPNVVTQVLGSASSPSVVGGCMDVNGVMTCSYSQAFILTSTGVASSTICAFPPQSATSTLVFASVKVASTSAVATLVEFGKGKSYFATTTTFTSGSISANTKQTLVASTTRPSNDGDNVFGTSDWLSIKAGGSVQLGGICKAQYIVN